LKKNPNMISRMAATAAMRVVGARAAAVAAAPRAAATAMSVSSTQRFQQFQQQPQYVRNFSSESGGPNDAEASMMAILKTSLEGVESVVVTDVSGGCGSMYDVKIVAEAFRGLSRVKQHQLVNVALKKEIKDMHGSKYMQMTR
jgi:stress-induced morphogen